MATYRRNMIFNHSSKALHHMSDTSNTNAFTVPDEDAEDVRRGRSSRRSGRSDVMRYARDNRFVQAVYGFTTGPLKPLFIAIVVVAVVLGIYFPVRDLYIAYRSQVILEQQLAIREAYNSELEEDIDALTTEEGVQDIAREELGMVMEGETPVTVTGLDDEGNAIIVEESSEDAETDSDADADSDTEASDDSSGSSESDDVDADADSDDEAESSDEDSDDDGLQTSADVEAEEEAVYEESAWYWKVLDAIFFFDGTSGQAVVSTGE